MLNTLVKLWLEQVVDLNIQYSIVVQINKSIFNSRSYSLVSRLRQTKLCIRNHCSSSTGTTMWVRRHSEELDLCTKTSARKVCCNWGVLYMVESVHFKPGWQIYTLYNLFFFLGRYDWHGEGEEEPSGEEDLVWERESGSLPQCVPRRTSNTQGVCDDVPGECFSIDKASQLFSKAT